MATPILQTERLVFHPFGPDDLPLLADLHSHAEVQRHLGGPWSEETIRARLAHFVSEQAELGFSKWRMHLKDGTFIGRAGVSRWAFGGGYELGYSLKPAFWGAGFATEAARGVAAWIWRNTAIDTLHGFTSLENHLSRRVLERVGMTFVGERDVGMGDLSALYRLDRPN